MTRLFLFRLVLDLLAISLFLAALAYDWLGNSAHELVGTALFLLLISHNIFNRRWYGTITRAWHNPRLAINRTITLTLLGAMLVLLVTSVIISQKVFSFLPLTSTFSARQLHASVAYLALLAVGAHLGLHWAMLLVVVRSKIGATTSGNHLPHILRLAAASIAALGIYSLSAVNVRSKLFMEMSFGFWDFRTATLAFFSASPCDHRTLCVCGPLQFEDHPAPEAASGPLGEMNCRNAFPFSNRTSSFMQNSPSNKA